MTDWNENWHPDEEDEMEVTPTVKVTKFGEGYEQRTPFGIHTKPRVWSLKFTRPLAEIRPILSFLEEKGGVASFSWKDPLWRANKGDGTPDPIGKYVCRKWNVRKTNGLHELIARFEQVFDASTGG